MIKNPVQVRLEKLSLAKQRLFMVCLCERMYINFVFYCRQEKNDNDKMYRRILDLVWESLLIKGAKINFDLQLDKLQDIIPIIKDDSPYIIYPAIDACQALGEILHSYLTDDIIAHTVQVSQISAITVAECVMTKQERLLSILEQSQLTEVIEEFDIQWEILRLLRDDRHNDIELIKGLKKEIQEEKTSNIGVFLSNQPF